MSTDSCLGILADKGLCFLTSHLGQNKREWVTQATYAKDFPAGRAVTKGDVEFLEWTLPCYS